MLLTIDKLVYGGDGLAHAASDAAGRRQAIFVPFVLQGEQVETAPARQGRGFSRAELERIVSPAAQRVAPGCPYYGACGGCQYQHAAYEHQLAIKSAILRESLRRLGGIDWTGEIAVHASPPWQYRNRTRMQVLATGAGGNSFALAYFRFGSRQPLAVEHCPISSALIDRAIAAILTLGRAGGFPQGIREIEFFADAADECLMLELYLQPGAHMSRRDLRSFFDRLREQLPEAATLALFPPSAPRSAQGREQMIAVVVGDPGLTYSAAGFQFRVSPGAFFQTNRFMTEKLVELVATGHTGNSALDLYAGVGLFALPLARSFATVTAVEAAPASAGDLAHNVPPNVRAVAGTAEKFLASRSVPQPDYIVVDPPRAGLGTRVTSAIARMAPAAITYVSCDPSTLARDLKLLLAAGYRLTGIDLVDLFPQTFHIESVVQLSRT